MMRLIFRWLLPFELYVRLSRRTLGGRNDIVMWQDRRSVAVLHPRRR